MTSQVLARCSSEEGVLPIPPSIILSTPLPASAGMLAHFDLVRLGDLVAVPLPPSASAMPAPPTLLSYASGPAFPFPLTQALCPPTPLPVELSPVPSGSAIDDTLRAARVAHTSGELVYSANCQVLDGTWMHDMCQRFPVGCKVVNGSHSGFKGPCEEQETVVNGRVKGVLGIESRSKRIQN